MIKKFLLTEFLYNGHLQALGSVGIFYISSWIGLRRIPSFVEVAIVYLTFETIFIFDRFRDRKKDRKTNSVRSRHLEAYAKHIPKILVSMLVLWIFLMLKYLDIKSFLATVFILIMGILYPIYFKHLTAKIYFFKNLYVSGVYCVLVLLPFLYNSAQVTQHAYLLSIFILAESFISQITLDTKDTSSDKAAGLKTFPAVVGNKATFKFLQYTSVASVVIFGFAAVLVSRPLFLVLAVVSGFLNLGSTKQIQTGQKAGYIFQAAKFFIWFCCGVVFNAIM